jgi:hypothetical protein
VEVDLPSVDFDVGRVLFVVLRPAAIAMLVKIIRASAQDDAAAVRVGKICNGVGVELDGGR